MSEKPGELPRGIAPGSRVTLHFSLADADGQEAISTFGEEPAVITLGDGSLTEGLELALFGLSVGSAQTIRLTPERAFGYRDEDRIQTILKSDFPAEIN